MSGLTRLGAIPPGGLLLCLLTVVSVLATGGGDAFALVWPVNAVACALLVRSATPPPAWSLPLFGMAIAAGNLIAGTDWRLAAAFAAINLGEIAALWMLMQRRELNVRRVGDLFRLTMAVLLVTGVGAACAGTVLMTVSDRGWADAAMGWFAANALGQLILLPPLLAVGRRDLARLTTAPGLGQAASIIGLATAIAMFVFSRGTEPLLFLLMPCGVFAAFRAGFLGATLSTLPIAIVAALATTGGHGPIAGHFPDPGMALLFLQGYLAVITLVAFPVATLLSQRAAALAATRAREAELRLITDNATDMICRIGLDGVRRYVSPASFRLLGYAPPEMVGNTPIAAIHPDDRARVTEACQSLLAGAENPVCTDRQQHRDGSYVWLEASYRLVTRDGAPVEFVASVRNIERRRDAEQAALIAQEQVVERERLLGMAEAAAQVGHWRLNAVDMSLMWSDEVFRIYGLPRGEPPAVADAINSYHINDRDMVNVHVTAALGEGRSFDFEARILRPDGSVRWVASSGQAERAPNGDIVGVFGVFQDITDRVTTLEETRRARVEAEEALAARQIFTATMTHEIRTPLTSILGAVALLRDAPSDADHHRHLDTVDRAGRILSGLVEDVLIFSRLEGGRVEPERIAFDLRGMIDDVVQVVRPALDARQLRFDLVARDGGDQVIGDPVRLGRVLSNLLANAAKFTQRGFVRLIVADLGDDRWRFEVADSGMGIAADQLGRVFDPFVQADPSTTRRFGGTGLGLSICRMLVDAMGGTLAVESAVGQGSTFWFTLTLPAGRAVPAGPSPAVPVRQLNILVAEDNDTNRYLIGELIRRLGHRVETVTNGARAVELVCAPPGAPFDHVLLDIQMPVMDGLSAARAIRAVDMGATVPIHALTADLSPERRALIEQAGFDGVLAKPIDIAALEQLLASTHAVEASAGAVATASEVIETGRMRALEATLGTAGRNALLSLMIDDARAAPVRIREFHMVGRQDLVRLEAHSLRGAAASVGAVRLVELLQRIEADIGQGALDAGLIDDLDTVVASVIASAAAIIAPTRAQNAVH